MVLRAEREVVLMALRREVVVLGPQRAKVILALQMAKQRGVMLMALQRAVVLMACRRFGTVWKLCPRSCRSWADKYGTDLDWRDERPSRVRLPRAPWVIHPGSHWKALVPLESQVGRKVGVNRVVVELSGLEGDDDANERKSQEELDETLEETDKGRWKSRMSLETRRISWKTRRTHLRRGR